MPKERTPAALGRADVRRCGTLWVATRDDSPMAQRTVPGTRIRAVAPGDAGALRHAMNAAGADNPGLAEVRVGGGRLGYLAEQTGAGDTTPVGTVLAYGWIARFGDTVGDLGFPLELPAGEGWIYDCATIPAARGKGLYTALLRVMRAEFPRRGLERGWIGTEPRNWASQRGIARAGFEKVADVDWSDETETMYGAPGFPEAALRLVSLAMGDGERSNVLPNAGIPWIEAVLVTRGGTEPEAEGLRAFREAYGKQVHWSRQEARKGEESRVILRCGGGERAISTRAAFAELAQALEELAPGLPWLGG